jgi:hypothetical protein
LEAGLSKIIDESASITWLNGPDVSQNGFTQEQLVIYKLGTIESQIQSLVDKVSSGDTGVTKMVAELKIEQEKDRVRITALEKRFDAAQNKFLGIAGVVSFLLISMKVVIFKWLNIS